MATSDLYRRPPQSRTSRVTRRPVSRHQRFDRVGRDRDFRSWGTFRTQIDVRLESVMRFKADIRESNIATNSIGKFQSLIDRLFLKGAGLSICVYSV